MKYIITENRLLDIVRKLMGGKTEQEKEENKRRTKKVMDKFMTFHLFKGLTAGEVKGYVKGWYKGDKPVVGLTHNGMMNFNDDFVEELREPFGLTIDEAKEIMSMWMKKNLNITEPFTWVKPEVKFV